MKSTLVLSFCFMVLVVYFKNNDHVDVDDSQLEVVEVKPTKKTAKAKKRSIASLPKIVIRPKSTKNIEQKIIDKAESNKPHKIVDDVIELVKSNKVVEELLHIADTTVFGSGELIDKKMHNGRVFTHEVLSGGEIVKRLTSPDGILKTELLTNLNGETLIKTFFEDGDYKEVMFKTDSGEIHMVSFHANGEVEFKRTRINGKTYSQTFDDKGNITKSIITDEKSNEITF